MTARRDADDLIRSYIEDGPSEMRDQSFDAVRSAIDHKRQRVVIGPWRVPDLNTYARYGIAAAAIVLVAALGFNLISRPGEVASPDASPTAPAPTSSPTATASPTAAPPSATPTDDAVLLPEEGVVAPGTYYGDEILGDSTVRLTFTLPEGWTRHEGLFKDAGQPTEVMWHTWHVTHIFADACDWDEGSVVEVESAEDFILALTNQAGREPTEGSWPWRGEIGGLPATGVELAVPADLELFTCKGGNLRYWPYAGPDFRGGMCCNPPGNVDFVYAVDVNGETLAIVARHYPDSTAENRAELQQVLESMQIDP